jgi:hypothetical protein
VASGARTVDEAHHPIEYEKAAEDGHDWKCRNKHENGKVLKFGLD